VRMFHRSFGKLSPGVYLADRIDPQGSKTPSKDMNSESRQPASPELDRLASITVSSIFEVHRELGPGLLESVYEYCLLNELHRRGLEVRCQVVLPIIYKNSRIDGGLRLDMLVEDQLVVELKAVESLLDVHTAQMLTYLKLSHRQLGLLVNFNVPLIKHGIKRIIL
jgi:GxxExxY protein